MVLPVFGLGVCVVCHLGCGFLLWWVFDCFTAIVVNSVGLVSYFYLFGGSLV